MDEDSLGEIAFEIRPDDDSFVSDVYTISAF
jgi:hypothetical protein